MLFVPPYQQSACAVCTSVSAVSIAKLSPAMTNNEIKADMTAAVTLRVSDADGQTVKDRRPEEITQTDRKEIRRKTKS